VGGGGGGHIKAIGCRGRSDVTVTGALAAAAAAPATHSPHRD